MKWKLITVCIAAAACLIIRSSWISVTVLAVCIAMMLIEDIKKKKKVEKQVAYGLYHEGSRLCGSSGNE